MPGLEACRMLEGPAELNEAWRVCPLIPGYPQVALGGLGLEKVGTTDRGPDNLGGKWKP